MLITVTDSPIPGEVEADTEQVYLVKGLRFVMRTLVMLGPRDSPMGELVWLQV